MKLRLVTTLLSLLLIALLLPALAFANSQDSDAGVPLFFNGKQLKPEVAPRIIKDVTMVPVRIIAEELGSKVEWNQKAQQVTITKKETKIQMVINQPAASVNGIKQKLDAAPVLIAGNTLLPVRFIAENMGIDVNWDDVTRAVYLTETPSGSTDPTETVHPPQEPGDSADKPATDASGKPVPVIKSIAMTDSRLQITADSGKLSPTVFPLHGPERIVVDIPNAVLDPALFSDASSKSGSTVSSNVYVSTVRYSQFNIQPYTVRIVLDMKGSAGLSWESGLQTAALVGVIQQGGGSKGGSGKYKVVIDPGHGDQDPGARAAIGRDEKEFNLAMGLKVYNLLQQEAQIEPYMTRNDDTFVPLDDRGKFANDLNADLFVSIHGNSYIASSTGTETYYYKSDSIDFANVMHKHLAPATGFADRGVRQEAYRVVKITNMPAILLEVGFLSNPTESATMFDEAFQNKVAAAIVAGIKEQLQIP